MGIHDRSGNAPEASEELKAMGKEVHNALTALREATETKNRATLTKVEDFFTKYEDEKPQSCARCRASRSID